jgi:sulfite exporter TauE/SafE
MLTAASKQDEKLLLATLELGLAWPFMPMQIIFSVNIVSLAAHFPEKGAPSGWQRHLQPKLKPS